MARRNAKADLNKLTAALARVYGKPYDELIIEWNKGLAPYWSKHMPLRPEDRRALELLAQKNKLGKIEHVGEPRGPGTTWGQCSCHGAAVVALAKHSIVSSR